MDGIVTGRCEGSDKMCVTSMHVLAKYLNMNVACNMIGARASLVDPATPNHGSWAPATMGRLHAIAHDGQTQTIAM